MICSLELVCVKGLATIFLMRVKREHMTMRKIKIPETHYLTLLWQYAFSYQDTRSSCHAVELLNTWTSKHFNWIEEKICCCCMCINALPENANKLHELWNGALSVCGVFTHSDVLFWVSRNIKSCFNWVIHKLK